MKAWEEEKVHAKAEKRRAGQPQPKWKRDFQPKVLPPRPKKDDAGEDKDSINTDEREPE